MSRSLEIINICTFQLFSIYMQTTVLRAICMPLMYHDDDDDDDDDDNWMEIFDSELKVHQNNYQDMITTVDNILQDLSENRVSNAYKVVPIYLDVSLDNFDHSLGHYVVYLTNKGFLNENFAIDVNCELFNMVVVLSTNVYYLHPDLFYYSNGDNISVVVGLGKIRPEYSCDDDRQLVKKKLTCSSRLVIGISAIMVNILNIIPCNVVGVHSGEAP